jgi:hypothetical protein
MEMVQRAKTLEKSYERLKTILNDKHIRVC